MTHSLSVTFRVSLTFFNWVVFLWGLGGAIGVAHGLDSSEIRKIDTLKSDSLKFEISSKFPRFRYRLFPVDPEWRDTEAWMRFTINFLNEDLEIIEKYEHRVTGDSLPASERTKNQRFRRKNLRLELPKGTSRLGLVMSSAGPPGAVGVYEFSKLDMTLFDGVKATELLLNVGPVHGSVPEWRKTGTIPSMASEVLREDGSRSLLIQDNQGDGHGTWALAGFPVSGTHVELAWEEFHTISNTNVRIFEYDNTPPGQYQFRVEEKTLAGDPSGNCFMLEVIVPAPIWARWWLWLILFLLFTLGVILVNRSKVRKKALRQLSELKLLEDERVRISRNLHDHLGIRLSEIVLSINSAAQEVEDEVTRDSLKEISVMSKDLAESLSEALWALDSKNDNLESLVDFLCGLAAQACHAASIQCRISAQDVDRSFEISGDFRNQFRLALKEGINNILKHSGASKVFLEIKHLNESFQVVLKDNGSGFQNVNQKGYGLVSMNQRMKDLGGDFEVSTSTEGTHLRFSCPLAPNLQNKS